MDVPLKKDSSGTSTNRQKLYRKSWNLSKWCKIYDNIVDRKLKPWQASSANVAVYNDELGLNTFMFRVQIKSHMIHFQI